MVFSRLLVVLTPGACAQELIAGGDRENRNLWTWWSTLPEGLVPKFDLMWFSILARWAKQKWMQKIKPASGDKDVVALQRHLPWALNKAWRTLQLPQISPSAGSLGNMKDLSAVPGLDRYQIPEDID